MWLPKDAVVGVNYRSLSQHVEHSVGPKDSDAHHTRDGHVVRFYARK